MEARGGNGPTDVVNSKRHLGGALQRVEETPQYGGGATSSEQPDRDATAATPSASHTPIRWTIFMVPPVLALSVTNSNDSCILVAAAAVLSSWVLPPPPPPLAALPSLWWWRRSEIETESESSVARHRRNGCAVSTHPCESGGRRGWSGGKRGRGIGRHLRRLRGCCGCCCCCYRRSQNRHETETEIEIEIASVLH